MSGKLTHADIQEILALVDGSGFDEFKLETADLKLQFRRGNAGHLEAATDFAAPKPEASAAKLDAVASTVPAISRDGLTDIRAPMLGCYYGRPKPGAEPFVQIGGRVTKDSVIGIIEVMKLMNPVPAGIAGEVVECVAKDGELIEYGAVILRIREG
jgi:acetyl-CoA carboxylase biotin carboxyl carrier protein